MKDISSNVERDGKLSINSEECRKIEGGKNDIYSYSCLYYEFKKTTKTSFQ
jgi:hypothetical protein